MIDTSAFPAVPRASRTDGEYPRPQLVRGSWLDLGGEWEFAYDDANVGLGEGWFESFTPFPRTITVPFPPESTASGIGETGFHPVVWYRRAVSREDLGAAGIDVQGGRLMLRFGAVDYRASVWVDGRLLGHHEGGHTPFAFEVPLHAEARSLIIVVRAEDDPHDVAQPRGKQDWQLEPHGIWLNRTSGIWQPVWMEAVPDHHIRHLDWATDLTQGTVTLNLEFDRRPVGPATVTVALSIGDEELADLQFTQQEPRSSTVLSLARQTNGQAYEALLWSPETPRLVDATVLVSFDDGTQDAVSSYLGLRSVGWAGGHFMLNDRPYYVRSVLEQGYWPESHLAAPSADAIRDEVELARNMGFNAVRIHEKTEDPRYLYWADRLGLMVWGENASAFEFSTTAVERSTREWLDIVRRDRSHPSIVTWVPLNESWGVQHISHNRAQLAFAQGLYHLTRALDPSRPVVSNDGWEHADSDIWTIHDYSETGAELSANYADRAAVDQMLSGIGPIGRRMRLLDRPDRDQPVMVSEFGGASYPVGPNAGWGYVTVSRADQFESILREQFGALQSSPVLAGFCYTQLTDTLQEANGLAGADRRPKLPLEVIRSIVQGEHLDISAQRRPKRPMEKDNTAALSSP